MRVLQTLALGAELVAAIAFTSPAHNSTLTRGSKHHLTWSSVETDPDVFSVFLVNFVNWPPYYKQLDLDVDTKAGTAAVRVPCDIDVSSGYQFNAINGTNVYVIYAQTPKFSITGDSCVEPAPANPTAPSCAPQPTVFVTVRGSNSSSHPPPTRTPPHHHHQHAVTTTVIKQATITGECPSTIGWNGGYNKPIVLNKTIPPTGAVATPHPTAPVVAAYGTPYPAPPTTPSASEAVPTSDAAAPPAYPVYPKKGGHKKGPKKCAKKRHNNNNNNVLMKARSD